jgi:hypothetical protein
MHVDQNDMPIETETTEVKHSKADVRGKARPTLDIRFEPQNLTSYSGLILFQHFFALIGIKERLWGCFRHLQVSPIYGHHIILMLLVVHLIIGHRRLRDVDYYRDDEMVKRVLGLKRLPDVSTISRSLGSADALSVEKVRGESKNLVLERLLAEGLARVTLDFDGSVLSTGRHAEGTAVGFNKKEKGARSYYPLFCTVAQTDQVLDVHHRPGNVHDSNGADAFIGECLQSVHAALPQVRMETCIDSAFFNETIAERLHGTGVEFTLSVPFERFLELKGMIEGRRRWRQLNGVLGYFETRWKPKSWSAPYRFLFIRKRPGQGTAAARALQAHRIRLRLQGHRNQQARQPAQGRCLSRGAWFARGHLCRTQVALPNGLRAGYHPYGQSAVYVCRHSRAQSHPRITDAGDAPGACHHGKTGSAVVFPRNRHTASHSHPTRRTHHSSCRQTDPVHE